MSGCGFYLCPIFTSKLKQLTNIARLANSLFLAEKWPSYMRTPLPEGTKAPKTDVNVNPCVPWAWGGALSGSEDIGWLLWMLVDSLLSCEGVPDIVEAASSFLFTGPLLGSWAWDENLSGQDSSRWCGSFSVPSLQTSRFLAAIALFKGIRSPLLISQRPSLKSSSGRRRYGDRGFTVDGLEKRKGILRG